MSKILYAAVGIILMIISALFLFIRGNAFITPESAPEPTPIVTIPPTPVVIEHKDADAPAHAKPSISFACPPTKWIDCMPGPNKPDARCDTEYLDWAQVNCPGFKGAAY